MAFPLSRDHLPKRRRRRGAEAHHNLPRLNDLIRLFTSALMRDAGGVLPRVENVADNFVQAMAVFDLGKHKGPLPSHQPGIPAHDLKVGADGLGQIGLVDDQQVGLGNARTAFARDFVAPSDVNDLNGKIG